MRINNNIMAMNTHRQYTINTNSVAKSTEKLSSGYRINRAGDDAAGLAISEKMRAQIRGLTMASKNSNDAISLIQTAEGALQETHNILQRMRELAVQSSSDTNESTIDRNALDKEYQALIAEINDTADKTRFNDQNLIDGTFAQNKMNASSTNPNVASAWASTSVLPGTYDVTFSVVNLVAEVVGAAGTVKAGEGWDVSGGGVTIANGDGAVVTATYAAPTGTANEDSSANGTWTLGYNATTKMYTFSNTSGEVLTAAASALAKGGTQTLNFGKAGTITLTNSAANDLSLDSITGITPDAAGDNTVTLENAATPRAPEYAHYASMGGESIRVEVGMKTLVFGKSNISVSFANTIASATKHNSAHVGNEVGTVSVTVTKSSEKALTIQTGANQYDELAISIEQMNAASLGVAGSSVSTRLSASAAITQTNTAINLVSTQRAALGALQNRLQHKINNLDTSAENLAAAESRIRDLDMAKEMTNFTRNNILVQASTAMLAQANAAPQGVLQLLQ